MSSDDSDADYTATASDDNHIIIGCKKKQHFAPICGFIKKKVDMAG